MIARPDPGTRSGAVLLRMAWLGVLWRWGLALGLLLTGTAGIAAVAVGPLWNRASLESNLQETFRAVGSQAGVRLFAAHGARTSEAAVSAAAGAWARAPGSLPGYSAGIRGLQTAVKTFTAKSDAVPEGQALVYRSGACRVLAVVQGRCPRTAGEVMVSEHTVAERDFGYVLGARLTVIPAAGPVLTYRIAGVYRVEEPDAPYWFGLPFASGPGFDPLLTTPAGVQRVGDAQPVSISTDYLLDPRAVRLADVPRVDAGIAALQRRFADQRVLRVESGFDRVVAEVRRRQAATDLGGTLVTLQLALLAVAVLFQIATDSAEARAAEVALLTLRGATRLRTIVFTLGEPLLLLAAATPLGLAAGYAGVRLLAPTVMLPGTPVLIDAPAVLAALAGFAGGAVAVAVAARHVLRSSVLQLWRRTERAAAPGRSRAIDLALAAVAVAGTAALLVAGRAAGPALLLAPGLLVAAIALLGVRLVPLLARRALAPTRTAASVPLLLAVRQVARRPAGLRLVAVLTIALGLSSFAVVAQGAAVSDRAARAAADVGAARTYRVVNGLTPSVTAAAVDRADPDGRWAMAATTWLPGGGSIVGTVLAVQSRRLAAVGLPVAGGPSLAAITRAIAPPVAPVRFRADRVAVALRVAAARPSGVSVLALDLLDARGRRQEVLAGALTTATGRLTASVPCGSGCELLGITWLHGTARGRVSGDVLVTGFTALRGSGAAPVAVPRNTGSWVAAPPVSSAADRVTVSAAGIRDVFSSSDGGYGGVQLASRPTPVPVFAAPGAVLSRAVEPSRFVQDAGSGTTPIRVVRTGAPLPVVSDAGAVVDVEDLDERLGGFAAEAGMQVWVSAAAPADATARLAAGGLRLRPLGSVAATEARLARQGPALSLLLLVACAAAGALVAMLATAVSIAGTVRRRSYEAAAMLALGLRRRQVAGAALAEQSILLAAAVVLGVPAGWLAALITLPVLPRFDTATPIALTTVPSPVPALLLAAVFLLLVLVAAGAGTRAVLRTADGSRLREGEE